MMWKCHQRLASTMLIGGIAGAGFCNFAAAESAPVFLRLQAPTIPVQSAPTLIAVEAVDSEGGACAALLETDTRHQVQARPVCAEEEVTRGIKFKAGAIETTFGAVEFHAAMGKLMTADASTIERVMYREDGSQQNTTVSVGFVNRLFDGRLTLATDLAWGQDSAVWRNESGAPSSFAAQDRTGAARWHRFDARLIDTQKVRWLASGEWSSVGADYVANSGGRPKLSLAIPGDRARISTSLKIWDTTLSAVTDTMDGPFQRSARQRLKLAIDGLELGVSTRSIDRISRFNPALPPSRSQTRGAAIELMPELLVPETLASLGDLAPLIPSLISIDWDTGQTSYPALGSGGERTSSFEALLTWSGTIGETTALYSREDEVPDGPQSRAGAGFTQLLDVSHLIKRGDWRFGFGVSMFDLGSSAAESGFADTAISGSFSIAHAPLDGPQIKLSAGHNRDRFTFADEDVRHEQRGLDLSLSVDLSPYVQRQIGRPNLKFELEYRRQIDRIDVTGLRAEQDDAEALMVNFRAPL